MRRVTKGAEPDVLVQNKNTWLSAYTADKSNSTKKYRYRHPDIKSALIGETHSKCVYCESKIGHNTPGDIEHKVPSSVDESRHFDWDNLTVACTECNRRKNDYYDAEKPFLDPYAENIESRIVHQGPIVSWSLGDAVSEVSIRILELNSLARSQLIARKVEHIDHLNNAVARLSEADPIIREVIQLRVREMRQADAEFSGMIGALCAQYGI